MVDGPNVYAYVTGNPVNLDDPMGAQGGPAEACLALPLLVPELGELLGTLGGIIEGGIEGGVIGGGDSGFVVSPEIWSVNCSRSNYRTSNSCAYGTAREQ